MLPVNVDELLNGTIVESDRIEFKSGWNPERVLHTICAFANDFDNIGGGYVVIGVGEADGMPREYLGLPPDEIPRIEQDLFNRCNLITPRYVPMVSHERHRGVDLLVIWAPRGESRPYKCPVSLSSSEKSGSGERACYIRRMSDTVCANQAEEIDLLMRSNRIPFDDMVNEDASVDDLMFGLVRDFLSRIGSRLDFRSMDDLELFRQMRIIRGPKESPRPLNVGLMMFSDRPERFFRNARIEVVSIPDETGTGMEESVFDGPLDDQLRKALSFIRSNHIREMVIKVPDRAEASRVYNYPYPAVEEVLVNAVYHKDYGIAEPVRVYIYPDRIEVSNCPGPDKSVSDEDIARFDMKCDFYRNGRLGDFLKELRLTEGRNTGIPKILRSLEENGSDMPVYRTDRDRRSLRVTIPVHEAFLRTPAAGGPDGSGGAYRDPEDTKKAILQSLRLHGCQSSRELALSIGYSGVNNTFRRCLRELMEDGEIDYLYPESPKDRRQRICLRTGRRRDGQTLYAPSPRGAHALDAPQQDPQSDGDRDPRRLRGQHHRGRGPPGPRRDLGRGEGPGGRRGQREPLRDLHAPREEGQRYCRHQRRGRTPQRGGPQGHHHGLRAHRRAHRGEGAAGGPGEQGLQGAGLLRLTVYSDGGSRGNPGKAAYAVVVTSRGEVIHEHAEFLGVRTNNYAEYRGIIAAIGKAVKMGAEEAEFVMDSQLVIRQMTGEYRVRNPDMAELHADAVALASMIPKVSYRNVRRSEEFVPRADALLNAELDRHRGRASRNVGVARTRSIEM